MIHTVDMSSSGLPLDAIVEDGQEFSCGDRMTAPFSVITSMQKMGARACSLSSFAHQFFVSAIFQPGAAAAASISSRQDARQRISPDSRLGRNCGVVFRMVAPEYLETHRSLAATSGKLSAREYCAVQ
ncbi:hypothetical protein GGI43DRAFT_412764 [Trichoderma evansii]